MVRFWRSDALEVALNLWMRNPHKSTLSKALATPPSLLFKSAVMAKNYLYDHAFLHGTQAPLFIISIGNLVVGGAGKTSLVAFLVKHFKKGPVAILCSGYRALARHSKQPLIVCRGSGPILSPEMAGDEAYLLASTFPEAIVISGRDRLKSASMASALGAKCAIIDDGMQYRELVRDQEVVVIDEEDPLGGGFFLPRGLLREEPRRLQEANLIAVIGNRELKLDLLRGKPCVRFQRRVTGIHGISKESLTHLDGMPVAIFSGIGNPAKFSATVRELKGHISGELILSDHRAPSQERLLSFAREVKARGARALLCTEKDWVKIKDFKWLSEAVLPIGWIASELEIIENKKLWDEWLENLRERIV